jgi:spore coat protein CotH
MPHRRLIAVALVAGVLIWPGPAPIDAQATAAEFFDPNTLQEIRLFIHSKDLALLKEHFDQNTYYPADLQWGTLRVRNVGVRSRGTGSRNANKLGIQVDFDRYTKGQRFLGLEGLVLDNLFQDESMMREMLAMTIFARMGQPAPREAYCRLFINSVDQGLYANVEPIDNAFLVRTLGQGDRYLFEYKWVRSFVGEDLGDDLATYKPMFEPRTHELDPDALLYGPIRELFREINGPDDAVWRERVEARIDLTGFVTQAAIETFLAENDALLGFDGMNNFYVYRGVGSDRHHWVPWDRDFAFTFLDSSIFREVDRYIMVQRALAQPDLRTHYLNVLEDTARLASEGDWLLGEIDRIEALISATALADTKKPYSNDTWREQVGFLREFAGFRPGFVMGEAAKNR